MARTTRIPNAFAGVGAVRQAGGSLPVYTCNTCHNEVVWADSKRTGRKYLVNVSRGYNDQRYYVGANVHKCNEIMAGRNAAMELARWQDRNRERTGRACEATKDYRRGRITQEVWSDTLDAIQAEADADPKP